MSMMKRIKDIVRKNKVGVVSICLAALIGIIAVGCADSGKTENDTQNKVDNTENKEDNTGNKGTDEGNTNEGDTTENGEGSDENNGGDVDTGVIDYIDNTHQGILMSLEGSSPARQCAVAFIGYTTESDDDKISEFIKNSKAGRIIPFISKLADSSNVVAKTGDEYYCIVPGSLDDKVYVYEWIRTEENDYEGERGVELYKSTNGKPFFIACNISDIMTNIEIVIEKADGTIYKLAPAISLMDGTVVNAFAETNENMDFYDISIYEEEDILLPQ